MGTERPTRRKLLKTAAMGTAAATISGAAGLGTPALSAESKLPHIPDTVSHEAVNVLQNWDWGMKKGAVPKADDRDAWKEAWQGNEEAQAVRNKGVVAEYKPVVENREMGGVPVIEITPRSWEKTADVLVYTHGGAYTMFSAGSTLISAVPHAHDTGRRVISVDYTTAPFANYKSITDQTVAVMTALVAEGTPLANIAIYGDSAGGGLTAATVLKMRDLGLGMPGAVILQSPWSDISENGDTYETLKVADLLLSYSGALKESAAAYADPQDHRHPYVSPVFADYTKGFAPTLIQGGTKEIFLSNFVRHYQVLDAAGVPVKLNLYEAMWHVFQAFNYELPESALARAKVKAWLDRYLGT